MLNTNTETTDISGISHQYYPKYGLEDYNY